MTSLNLFTIPAGASFADELARGIVARHASPGNPLALSEVLVLVPTRRAIRTLREAFERTAGGGMSVLPRIVALGDFDDEEAGIEPEADEDDVAALVRAGVSRKPISPLRRELLLFMLIRRWAAQFPEDAQSIGTERPAIALQLARELARMLDFAGAEGVDLSALKALVTGELAQHWEQTVRFLDILGDHWDGILDAHHAVDPAAHRDAALRAAAQRWLDSPPTHPVIAAGSTGSVPATAAVLHAIAQLPTGAVVLPGLDPDLDEASWQSLGPSHPQYGMAQLLERFAARRADVAPWCAAPPGRQARVRLIAEAMRPAGTTTTWQSYVDGQRGDISAALDGLTCMVARSPAEEALAIACALREAITVPGKTAGLVTPDRNLARRVASELKRWDITIDDSAGTPLSHTEPGRLLCLIADVVADGFAPVALLALLKHPQCHAGHADRGAVRQAALALEAAALRGARPQPGLAGVRAKMKPDNAGYALVDALEACLSPFATVMSGGPTPLATLVAAHRDAAARLSTGGGDIVSTVWAGEAGRAAERLFAQAVDAATDLEILLTAGEYAAFIREVMDSVAVRPHGGLHPRLAILGPLEARLQQFDLVILGGLNEGKWPPATDPGPWLNRPMRQQLGISQPERRIGLSAHDFAQAAAAPQVILTRSEKEGGAPTTPSRWLTRITTLVSGAQLKNKFFDARLVEVARMLDRPGSASKPIDAPAPCPPVAARPRTLPVTDVELWLRDPYALYAKRILRLKPLSPIDEAPGASDRGSAIHDALEEFVKKYPGHLPPENVALDEVLDAGRTAFGDLLQQPQVRAIWWPRFERAARWYLSWERARRPLLAQVLVEQEGALVMPAPGGPFTLKARADRIELRKDGAITLCDYKTGAPPSNPQVERGFSPQLTLEAAMALHGAFPNVKTEAVAELVYVQLAGANDGGDARPVKFKDVALADAIAQALDRFRLFVAAYDDPTQPYLSKPHVLLSTHAGDYDHLARVQEWSSEGAE